MRIFHGLEGLGQLPPGSVLTVGNFDGIHRGHQHLLSAARRIRADCASRQRTAALPSRMHRPEAEFRSPPGQPSIALVTFEPHPLTVLRPMAVPPRLTPMPLKQSLLESLGVDYLVVLPPTADVLNVSAEDFWRMIRDEARPHDLIEGSSFYFGKDRRGTIERLREWCAASSVRLHIIDAVSVPLLDMHVAPVSSSLIRWLLQCGRVRDAAICLGRPYSLHGSVVRGHQRGRGLGVATANLAAENQLIPADGVYAGRCIIETVVDAGGHVTAAPLKGSTTQGERTFAAAVSIGTNPTFKGAARSIEAHLIGFDGDLYGQPLRIDLVDWLREQRKYSDIEALKTQMQLDIATASELRDFDPARAIAAA